MCIVHVDTYIQGVSARADQKLSEKSTNREETNIDAVLLTAIESIYKVHRGLDNLVFN